MKKEKAIRFNSEMVQAILDERKTQTRRVINPQPSQTLKFDWPCKIVESPIKKEEGRLNWIYDDGSYSKTFTSLYQPSDILYVQETYSIVPDADEPAGCSAVLYAASGQQYGRLRSPVSMRKEYSRIWLEVTNVRVERLQDISEEDAKEEGSESGIYRIGPNTEKSEHHLELNSGGGTYRDGFKHLWQSIYGTWDKNPWVFVYDFKVMSTTGRPKQ